MDEEQKLLLEMERARQAQDLMEHPLFIEAREAYRSRLMAEWEASPARDSEGRERLWLMLKTLSAVEGHLSELMQTGKLAKVQLEQKRGLMERMKSWAGSE